MRITPVALFLFFALACNPSTTTAPQSETDGGCAPQTDAELCAGVGYACGPLTAKDRCGTSRTVDSCGTCSATLACGATAPGLCGSPACVAETDAELCTALSLDCGGTQVTDRCGTSRVLTSCGSCPVNQTCAGGGVANVCGCTAETGTQLCQTLGKNCGAVTGVGRCGQSVTVPSCGTCSGSDSCGGSGVSNVCGSAACVAETDASLCTRFGKDCGGFTATDNCGHSRTVSSCGTCSGSSSCGGGGVANVCACAPETNQAFCSAHSAACGAVTAADNCGTSRSIDCGGCSGAAYCSVHACLTPPEVVKTAFVSAGLGWQWMTPLPTGVDLTAVRAFSASDVWIAGQAGTLLHWNGSAWSQVATGSTSDLTGLWGPSSSNFWLTGTHGTLLHYDGAHVSALTSGTTLDLHGIWGRSGTDFWAVGGTYGSGVVLHYNGSSVSTVSSPAFNLSAVVGNAADVWAVGQGVTHWNGTSWSVETLPGGSTVYAATLTPAGDVWAGGDALYQRTGGAWYKLTSPTSFQIRSLWSAPNGEIWEGDSIGILEHSSGGSWSTLGVAQLNPSQLLGIDGASAEDAWVVGSRGILGRVAHGHFYLASTDRLAPLGAASDYGHTLLDLRVQDATTLTLAGREVSTSGGSYSYPPVVGRWSNGTLKQVGPYTADAFSAVWSSSDTDVVGVSLYKIDYLLDTASGSLWTSDSCTLPTGLFALSAADIWVAAGGGNFCRRVSGSWVTVHSAVSQDLADVWMLSATDGFAVGNAGTVLRYLSGSWVALTSPSASSLLAVWASSPTDVWTVSASAVFHWNGSSWSSPTVPTAAPRAVWGSASNDVWISAADSLVHWDGSSWSSTPVPSGVRVTRGISAQHAYAVTNISGGILQRQ